jgi:GT2 family glycosyltransferase
MIKVIMPCYNINESLVDLTRDAIYSLKPDHLTIIDNNSSFGAGFMREVADVYIKNKTNLGYAKAVNQGLNIHRFGELMAVANNDIVVSSNWKEVTEEIMKDKNIVSLHFKMVPYNGFLTVGDDVWVTGKERWCTGSFFVMRNYFRFDERFLNSYDDWDIHLRMYQKGYHTAYTNKAVYKHLDSATQVLIPGREEQDRKNRDYFFKKHGDTPENIWMKMFPDQMKQDYRLGFL